MMRNAAARSRIVAGWIVFALAANPGPGLAASDVDRPQFSETPLSMRTGDVHAEFGTLAAAGGDGLSAFRAPELQVRIGVVSRTELRLGYDHGWLYDDGDFDRDEGRATVGAKFQLVPRGAHWGLAVLPSYTLDPGEDDTGRWAVLAPWSYEVSPTFGVAGSGGFERNPSTDVQRGILTLMASRTFTQDHTGFLEWAMDLPEGEDPVSVLHFGYTLATGEDAEFDVHGGIGVGKDAPDAFLGVGFSLGF